MLCQDGLDATLSNSYAWVQTLVQSYQRAS